MKMTVLKRRFVSVALSATMVLTSAFCGVGSAFTVNATGTETLISSGCSMSENGNNQSYVAANANDGNTATYWEGVANSWPSILTMDLGSVTTANEVILLLPSGWGTRTQTFSILTSTDGTNYTTTVASNTYTFNPSSNNSVEVDFTSTSARYIRLNFTTNSGAVGGQVAEMQVYSPTSSGTPDLIVTGISYSPASPTTGVATTFSATVKNQGTGATPAGIIIGVSFFVDGTQVSWSDTDTTSLAAGDSVTLTSNNGPSGTASWTATSGTHTILANVDDVNRITESNESNNTYSTSLTVSSASQPDLIVTGITASPSSPVAGNAVTFTATVYNQGSAAGAPGTVAFSVDGTQVTTSSNNTTALAANSTTQMSGTTTWTATSGTHTILANVDSTGITSESNESNNTYSTSLTVSAASQPDLIITGITTSPTSPTAGDSVTFTATVYNQGTASGAPGTVTFSVDGTQVTTSSNNTTALGAGSSTTMSGTTTWPATSGSHTISSNVDINNITIESNESNNSYSTTLSVSGGGGGTPDLIVTGITYSPASPVTGNAVTFSAIVKNQGTGATPAGTIIGAQFQVDGTCVSWSDNDINFTRCRCFGHAYRRRRPKRRRYMDGNKRNSYNSCMGRRR